MTTVEQGFVKGQSDNLPAIDSIRLRKHSDFMGAEMKSVKAKRSGRENYGDNAIGFVQIKREGNLCTVKARITPEHSIHKKAYSVCLVCDEAEDEIISVKCEDCAASSGGCKHAIALLTWVHRRSEDPPLTSIECYWKKSRLSKVGTQIKLLKAKDIAKRPFTSVDLNSNGAIFNHVREESLIKRIDTGLTKYWKNISATEKLSLHYLCNEFFENHLGHTTEDFLQFCAAHIDEEKCEHACRETMGQAENNLWNELRYARITASKIYEVSRCKTFDGVLVETIMGAYPIKDTDAMKRGRKLENAVRKQLSKEKNIKLNTCGLMISSMYPIIGASADAINEEFVVEIKCPTSEKTVKNYVNDGLIKDKYLAQLQLQMYLHKKQKGIFCIADPNFEKNKAIEVLIVDIDEDFIKNLIESSIEFWGKAIFPLIKKNFD